MFSLSGMFRSVQCPVIDECKRNPCPFSHSLSATRTAPFAIPVQSVLPASPVTVTPPPLLHSKRSVGSSVTSDAEPEPPRKVHIVAGPSKISTGNQVPRPTGVKSNASTLVRPKATKPTAPVGPGPPVLNANIASSKIPLKDRQHMLTTLYEQFKLLYVEIAAQKPALAGEHALAQEVEVYTASGSNKMIYRNGMIRAIASLKKRPPPTSEHHASVGTETQIQARATAQKSYTNLRLTSENLRSALLTHEQMKVWGYVTEIPEEWGVGGDRVNEVGNLRKCERCGMDFVVSASPSTTDCIYHWSRPYVTKVNGAREKLYKCCPAQYPAEGCQTGSHVFYESDPLALHSRHPFTLSSHYAPPSNTSTKVLDVVALDCEMIYTTSGMSLARVSVVDGAGAGIFDELVALDGGVNKLDYNTRFSGVTSLEEATKDLAGIRKALASLIGPNTIIVGHALENDLKALRMVHHRVVDTVELFPHRAGPPVRRALREIVRETLGQVIQSGAASSGEANASSIGHSSLEDARATLNLVRWWASQR